MKAVIIGAVIGVVVGMYLINLHDKVTAVKVYRSWSTEECQYIKVRGVKQPCSELDKYEHWENVWVK